MRSSKAALALITTSLVALAGSAAHAELAVSANDGKMVLEDGVAKVRKEPVPDSVAIIELSGGAPRIVAELPVPASVVGPPSSVAVASDESFALVTGAMKIDPADPTKAIPDDKLTVIDLKSSPPKVLATLQSGAGAAGVSINRAGTLALVANRSEGTVSVFTISGNTLTAAGKVALGDAKSGPSHPMFSRDGTSCAGDAGRRQQDRRAHGRRQQGGVRQARPDGGDAALPDRLHRQWRRRHRRQYRHRQRRQRQHQPDRYAGQAGSRRHHGVAWPRPPRA